MSLYFISFSELNFNNRCLSFQSPFQTGSFVLHTNWGQDSMRSRSKGEISFLICSRNNLGGSVALFHHSTSFHSISIKKISHLLKFFAILSLWLLLLFWDDTFLEVFFCWFSRGRKTSMHSMSHLKPELCSPNKAEQSNLLW